MSPHSLDAVAEGGEEVSRAAMEALESLQGKAVDDKLAARLSQSKGKMRMMLIELTGRRRAAAAAPALWLAADDADPAVRAAALASLGAMIGTADLPKLIARIVSTKDDREATALDKAVREVCLRSKDREAVAAKLAGALATADGHVKARILETLNVVGGRDVASSDRHGRPIRATRDFVMRRSACWGSGSRSTPRRSFSNFTTRLTTSG